MFAAVLLEKKGKIEVQEIATPEPQAGEVLIKLKAAAFNRRDYWIQQGMYAGLKFPIVLGSDGVGEVVKLGKGCPQIWLNKSVVIDPSENWGDNPKAQGKSYKILGLPENGTFAEYVVVKEEHIVRKPSHLDDANAAALPLAGVTAYRALFTRAALQKGEKVLITGIGGGVAVIALQMAVAAGAIVYVTSGSAEKIERAKLLGAAGGANYKESEWAKQLQAEAGQFDVIVDSAGGDGFAALLDLAAAGARIVTYGGTQGTINNISPQKIFWKQLSILGSTMGTAGDFIKMLTFVEKHGIVPVVGAYFEGLSEINEAMELLAGGGAFGKIVIGCGGHEF